MKTYSAKAADIEKKWVTIDAAGLVVAALPRSWRAFAAAQSDPHRVDERRQRYHCECSQGSVDRAQARQKKGITITPATSVALRNTAEIDLQRSVSERIAEKAVERMLPRGPLGAELGNLRVYPGPSTA